MEEPQVSDVETIREALQTLDLGHGRYGRSLAALDALVARLTEAERERDEEYERLWTQVDEAVSSMFPDYLFDACYDLGETLDHCGGQVNELRERAEAAEARARDLNAEYDSLRSKFEAVCSELRAKRERADKLEHALAERDEVFREIVRIGDHPDNRKIYLLDADFHAVIELARRAALAEKE
jgi:chromosome segregation ATPase